MGGLVLGGLVAIAVVNMMSVCDRFGGIRGRFISFYGHFQHFLSPFFVGLIVNR